MSRLCAIVSLAFLICATGAALAQDANLVSAGAEIYQDKCSECHGQRMVATGAGADLRELRAEDRAKFDKTVEEGRGQMPSWDGQFTSDELNQIWAYIRSRAYQ